ncbi:Uncharacterised protein [Serratia fonticola]|uniref:Uncharacterized protein n=1 Tax=Serratia fonticola TaxID=47917 RepID=A0A4U9WDB8_SERFO|nr:Uncharacterised protein [Serratia fonticola]
MAALKIQGTDFGAGKLLLKIDNLDGKGLKEFGRSLQPAGHGLAATGRNAVTRSLPAANG